MKNSIYEAIHEVSFGLHGDGRGLWPSFDAFRLEAASLIDTVWHADRSNGAARIAAKERFVVLMRENSWIVTYACVAYAAIVFFGPSLVARPLRLKPVLAVWNLALSIFSGFGAYHCLGGLFANFSIHGWRYTMCTKPSEVELNGTDLDVWAAFFVFSKLFEFFDTILKVLMKRDFIFLHWYHHLATAWLSWISIANDYAPGTWIAAINYLVHVVMYMYYFLSAILPRHVFAAFCKPVAPLITLLQTAQMFMFTIVNGYTVHYLYFTESKGRCNVKPLNLYANAVVVLSYMFLFMAFFFNKHIRRAPSAPQRAKKDT